MKKTLLLICMFLISISLFACNDDEINYDNDENMAKVVFYLEGGKYKTSERPVSYYYDFSSGITQIKIKDPNTIGDVNDQITLSEHHIEGWYQTKEEVNGVVTYSNKWDFENDYMTKEGITLYAKWKKNSVYKYELFYKQDLSEIKIGEYTVVEGQKFNANYIEYLEGYEDGAIENKTIIGYLDSEGNPWNPEFVHPGGDEDTNVKVLCNTIEGEYKVVKTANEFSQAIKNNKNIYLANDINFKAKELSFESYSGEILGNNFKLSNFTIKYNDFTLVDSIDDPNQKNNHVYISLFSELNDTIIKNLTIDDVQIELTTRNKKIVKVVVAPLAIKASNVSLINVNMSVNFTVKTYSGVDYELEVIKNNFFKKSENINAENSTAEIIEESN